jgi:hypothetical protein
MSHGVYPRGTNGNHAFNLGADMPDTIITRRRLLQSAGFAVAASVIGVPHRVGAAEVEAPVTISPVQSGYCGWPSIARTRSGDLLVVSSAGRDGHVCPFGRVEFMRSSDGGLTWTWPQTILDTAIDDRDAGILETQHGTLIASTFTSIAFEKRTPSEADVRAGKVPDWTLERLARWRLAQDRLSANERKRALGCWIVRSTDNGNSWSGPIPSVVNSPHGPTQLADGRLLYCGKQLWTAGHEDGGEKIGAAESTDDGLTWTWIGEIPVRPGDKLSNLHELHAVETADGRIVAQIRNHNDANRDETLQTESTDGGRTWTEPHPIGVWGYPSHLVRLKDDRLVMSYGYRRKPFGTQARVSTDHGRTWSDPITLSADGTNRDLGYTSTAETNDGTLVSLWYEQRPAEERSGSEDQTLGSAVLRMVRWQAG